jgi:peptide deformylase
MEIVSLDNIPTDIQDPPIYNLSRLYATGKQLESICIDNGGMGISASQVGIPWKFFVYWSNYPEKEQKFDYLFSCNYEPVSDKKSLSVEGCLSLKGMRFQVDRYDEIFVMGQRLIFNEDSLRIDHFKRKFSGILSVVLQHEIDHNQGRERMIDRIGSRIYIS